MDAPESDLGTNYNDFARSLLDADVNLMCVNRGSECLTSWSGLSAQPGDRLIYAAQKRLAWDELTSRASG